MRLYIEDLPVTFPYSLAFNEQVIYMEYLKKTLDSTGHAILEMPTGTGKTICLLALLTSYLAHRDKYKKVFCSYYKDHLLYKNSWLNVEDIEIVKGTSQKKTKVRTTDS